MLLYQAGAGHQAHLARTRTLITSRSKHILPARRCQASSADRLHEASAGSSSIPELASFLIYQDDRAFHA